MLSPKALVVILTTTAAMTACGGSGGESDGASSPEAPSNERQVTREDYIAAADDFCRDANEDAKAKNERIQRIVDRAETDDETFAAIAPMLEDGYAEQRDQDDEFQSIEPPAEDRETIEKLWIAQEERTAILGRLADAARSRDVARFGSLIEEQRHGQTRRPNGRRRAAGSCLGSAAGRLLEGGQATSAPNDGS